MEIQYKEGKQKGYGLQLATRLVYLIYMHDKHSTHPLTEKKNMLAGRNEQSENHLTYIGNSELVYVLSRSSSTHLINCDMTIDQVARCADLL